MIVLAAYLIALPLGALALWIGAGPAFDKRLLFFAQRTFEKRINRVDSKASIGLALT